MQIKNGEITLGDKTYKAIEVDYDSYETSSSEIELTSNGITTTYIATKVEGVENNNQK